MSPLRVLSGIATAGLLVAGLSVAGPASSAVIGTLQITPSSGNQDTLLTVDTSAKCPVSSKTFRIDLTGAGIGADMGTMTSTTNIDLAVSNPSGGYTVQVGEVFKDTFQRNNLLDPSGNYTLSFLCTDLSGFTVEAEMNGTVAFTPTANDFNATYVQASNATPTTTALGASPQHIVDGSQNVTLTATVTPSNAVGTVQFKSGATNISTPKPVVAGTATYTGPLPAGNAALTAKFVPTNANNFQQSTSPALPYVVVGAPAITGTVKVASTVTCGSSAGGTQSFVWIKNDVPTTVTTKSVKIPNTWYQAQIACQVSVTQNAVTVTKTSPAKAVAFGAPLKNTQAPVAAGTARVGNKLTCKPGTWTPAATSYAYKWLRNGNVIAGKTAKTYLLVAGDRGKRVGCQVTAKKLGHANGVAKSAARLIG